MQLKKILVVAEAEFSTLVRSKGFLIGILLLPVAMGGSMMLAQATRNAIDVRERPYAIVDHSGVIAAPLAETSRLFNASPDGKTGPRFLPVIVDPREKAPDALRLELSDKVRREELFAFVEIPAEILSPDTAQIRYYSNHPSYLALPQWLATTVSAIVQHIRLQRAGVDPRLVAQLTGSVRVTQLGIVSRAESGGPAEAQQVDRRRTQVVPIAFLMLMFITIMSSAPQLLNSVIEEKMSRISEVLVGSVTPFELMMGKLVGGAGVCALLAGIYLTAGLASASYWGHGDAVSLAQLAWLGFFLLMAVILFGSIFVAVGAACTDLKDSQNLVGPVMLVMVLPVVTAGAVLRAPDGTIATVLSMVPTATPFLMMLRILMHPGPPAWQVVTSVVLVIATALFCVWAAGRIFRAGLLMQGKSASLGEIVRWVRAG